VKPKNLKKIKYSIFILILSFFFSFKLAIGDEFKLIPSISLKEEYNDNLFFTERDKEKDFITTISPGLELSNKTERLDLNLLAQLNKLIYGKNDELNKLEQNYRGRIRYSFHPKLNLSANAGFTRDYRPDRDIEITGLVTKAIRRDKINFAGGAEYIYSEKTRGNLSYNFEKADYERDPEFVDTKAHELNIGLIHDLSQHLPSTIGRANLGYARYEFSETLINYYYGTIGMGRALSEKWNLIADLGLSYTRSEFDVYYYLIYPTIYYKEKKEKDGLGLVSQATLSYRGEKTKRGEKTTLDLSLAHRLMPASGTVGATKRTAFTFDFGHRLTYELLLRLSAGYYINRAKRGEFGIEEMDERTFRINPRLRYEFTKDIALEAYYSFTYLRDKDDDTKAKRNLFMVNLIIQYPLFE
jgi:hypothetical protein